MRRIPGIFITVCVLLSIFSIAEAKEYKAAVKKFGPMSDYFVNLINAVVEASGNTVKIEVVPPARADNLVSTKQVDFQYPAIVIPDPAKQAKLDYDFSSVVVANIPFILYTNKDKPIDVNSVKKGNPNKYLIEVDISRADDFNFQVSKSYNYEGSFKKLTEGNIAGLILGQPAGDPLLKKGGYKNIKRQLWLAYDQTFSLQKGARGGEVDKMLSDGVKRIKANGSFEKIMGKYVNSLKYDNWQP